MIVTAFSPTRLLQRWLLIMACLLCGNPESAADLRSDFESSWQKRRSVARYARCTLKTVRIIRANTLGANYHLPEQDLTVEDEHEWYVDLSARRFRAEESKYVSYPQEIVQMRFVSMIEKERARIFTVPNGKDPVPDSTPTVMETRADPEMNDVLLTPVLWALGFMDLQQFRYEDRFQNKGQMKSLENGRIKLVHRVEEMVLISDLDPHQGFAVTSLVLASSENFKPGKEVEIYTVTNEKLDHGWFPVSWQMESLSDSVSCTVMSWDFFDDVPEQLWDEPSQAREPGRLVLQDHQFRRVAPDGSLVPIGAVPPESSRWWIVCVVFVAVVWAALRSRRLPKPDSD